MEPGNAAQKNVPLIVKPSALTVPEISNPDPAGMPKPQPPLAVKLPVERSMAPLATKSTPSPGQDCAICRSVPDWTTSQTQISVER